MRWSSATRLLTIAFLLLLPALVLPRVLFMREAFVPADLLSYLSPWKAVIPPEADAAAWNVLRYDGIGQFYPWRLEASRQMHDGVIPLWNPYQLAAGGGTPLLANSQSAPLYPVNLLFYLLPVWQAFGVAAAVHLLIAASGMYLFLRALPLSRLSSLLGAAVYTLSGPVIVWLALPTFLAVSCWLPLLLLLIRRAHALAGTRRGRIAALSAGGVGGLVLLGGHLQIAFYCLLAAFLYALFLGVRAVRTGAIRPTSWLLGAGVAAGIAISLALVQVLPSMELSRISHRAAPATWNGYRMYSANALPVRNFAALLAPDFFGQPNAGTYWNNVNYSEWTLYVGVLPLLLAFYAAALPRRANANTILPRERFFFIALAALSLLMALGTPINIPFVFAIPGFAQTGSPARALILFAFAAAALAAIGLEALLAPSTRESSPPPEAPARPSRKGISARPAAPAAASTAGWAPLVAIAVPLLLAAIGAASAASYAGENIRAPFGDLLASAAPGLLLQGILFVLAAATLLLLPRLRGDRAVAGAVLAIVLALADLLSWGTGFNVTVPAEKVYPSTPGVEWLQANARDALIAPINRSWSLSVLPPRAAALPPNSLTVYRLHDLSGYDSLLTRESKERVRDAGGIEPSPPENGNIVFIKSVKTALALGARYLVFAPEAAEEDREAADMRRVYAGPDMVIYENPQGRNAVSSRPSYGTGAFRAGLFFALAAVAFLTAGTAGSISIRRR